ncbi:hypothetical protein B0H21DRAFT_743677 [Amylocystis lapponica]|nr:hypothetical protein B0H21DRAFT_743677 [Amylocystis lapponica]
MQSRPSSSQVSLIPPGSDPANPTSSDDHQDSVRPGIFSSPDDARAAHEQPTVAFVKGTKRKRLSKACDACHKSKRRCDGTAPCSNCYFASKTCTYTDASGRPVPAPRNMNHDTAVGPADHVSPQAETSHSNSRPDGTREATRRRTRPERAEGAAGTANAVGSASTTVPTADDVHVPRCELLDPLTTHELTNLFFAHCNPHRLVLHKPSFSAAMSHNRVPEYLVLVVCATAAPMSKTIGSQASLARLGGVPFAQEAVSIMFDASGRLLSEPSLATAQALCLLEMHEIAASHSWTKHFRYFELALQVLEESLEIHRPDGPLNRADPESVNAAIERECARRCFWLIQCMNWITCIYTFKPIRQRSVELMAITKLPIDETNFELTIHSSSATSENINIPAPRVRYASQFGHVCRILSIYQSVQTILATTKEGRARAAAIADARKALDAWVASLPPNLRFSEENLDQQMVMIETSSNTGAWCYSFMHAMHPCCFLAILEGEGRLSEPIQWVREQINMIFNAIGTRAKNTILSACVLWSYSKYHPEDPHLLRWDRDFENVWGFRVTVVADQWRKALRAQASAAADAPQQATPGAAGLQSGRSADGQPAMEGDPRFIQGHRRTDSDGVSRTLPSLKASGLLDSWKPPSDAFASALSISAQPREDEQRAGAPPTPRGAASAPVGLNWLNKS